MNYKFGFSSRGFVVILLPMLPNLFYFSEVNQETPAENPASSLLLNVLEHGSQAIFIFLLLFVKTTLPIKTFSFHLLIMAADLTMYYVLWIVYYLGNITELMLLGMAVFPVLYFLVAEIWLRNYLALIPTLVFGIVHIGITFISF